jgi:hypothetical protein
MRNDAFGRLSRKLNTEYQETLPDGGHARGLQHARRSRLWWTRSGKPTSKLQLRGRQRETIALQTAFDPIRETKSQKELLHGTAHQSSTYST